METKEVKVGGKTFTVKEILAVDLDKALEAPDKNDKLKNQIVLATGISDADYVKLTVRERMAIVIAMNELNGVGDFLKNSNQEKTE